MLSPVAAPTPPIDDVVKDVTLTSFKADVLEASLSALVLVDFWATWCGPCKQLTPILEKIARGSKGTIRIAKIDIDRNQPIAQQMGVQSVPSVFAFYQGRPVDAFAGALPEGQIKTWLDQLQAQIGIKATDEKPGLDTALKQAADLLAIGDKARARAIYEDILDLEPMSALAYAGVVRCLIEEGDTAKALQMLESAPADMAKDKIFNPLRAALELSQQASAKAGNIEDLEAKLVQNAGDHQARFDLALAFYAAGQREKALDALLEIVRRARSWNEDAARKQLVKFFDAFGASDALTISARKRLSSILFS